MKRGTLKKIFYITMAIMLLFAIYAKGNVGTDSDPLISLSYITNVVMPYIDNAVASSSSDGFEVVEIKKGGVITFGSGTEFILRSGEGIVSLDASASGGFTDVTSGLDITNGDALSTNHLMICARDDGRKVKTNSLVYMMVRGDYTIR